MENPGISNPAGSAWAGGMREVELAGGNANGSVVRVGRTVRKPAGPSADSVLRYLRHLQGHGIALPEHLGFDERGRQVLEFVPGPLAMQQPKPGPEQLARIGGMVRAIHDASGDFAPRRGEVFDSPIAAPGADLVCHNDLAPWNLVMGERWVLIDRDAGAPSTRLGDLAYAAQAFRAMTRRISARSSTATRPLPAMIERVGAMHGLLESSNIRGIEPWGSMYADGHGDHWAAVRAYLQRHRLALSAALERHYA
ncbi:phosphotransferase [Arthrobacter sp. MYb224]|uniref:phosphotransferase n=1 Tax=Arthrobacter sp. MYb224 TaxID=1848600 RepID=UPI002157D970|nr:phosphotransferase [Arthrobacter sp. MYb224]